MVLKITVNSRKKLQEVEDSKIQVSVQNLVEEMIDIVEDEEEIETMCDDYLGRHG